MKDRMYHFKWLFLSLWLGLICVSVAAQPVTNIPIAALAWSPDGTMIALAGGDSGCGEDIANTVQIYIFDVLTQVLLQTLAGNQCRTIALDWNADSTKLAASGIDAHARVWDVSSGELLTTTVDGGMGRGGIAWSPDDKVIANVILEHFIFVTWDPVTGEQLGVFGANPQFSDNPVTSVDWSPDSRQIVSGGFKPDNNPGGFVRIWDAATATLLREFDHPGSVTSVVWKPDGTQIASGSGKSAIRIWDVATGEVVQILHGNGDYLRWHPTENLLAASTGGDQATVSVWNTETGELIQTYAPEGWTVPAMAWSPFGGRLIYNSQILLPLDSGQAVLTGDAIQLVVPVPTFERLTGIAALCLAKAATFSDLLSAETLAALTVDQLPEFVTKVETLPSDAIPPACAADLIAVAEAIIAQ